MTPVTAFFKRKRFHWVGWVVAALAVLFVLVLLTPMPSDLLARPLTVNDTDTTIDAIVVLGGGTTKGSNTLPLQPILRVAKGVELSTTKNIPLILSGGYSKKTQKYEAPLLADEAIRRGVDASNITLESASRDTYENAVYSLAIVREHDWRSVAVVTSEYHTWRACRVFRKQFSGTVRCVPATSRDAEHDSVLARLNRFRTIVREYGAIVFYAMKGYL